MSVDHTYTIGLRWTGNRGTGTSSYRAYGREHVLSAAGKHTIEGSSDPVFHGDGARWNPEELLLGALTQCHLLSYLHVAASNGVTVIDYTDDSIGTMTQTSGGGGHFTVVTLRPTVTIADAGQLELARSLHQRASELCFIAASMNFPVLHAPTILAA